MRTGRALRAILSAAVVGAIAVVAACREPTQMEVSIVLRAPLTCSDLSTITIVVGKGARETEDKLLEGFVTTQTSCTGAGTVGTIVVTPSAGGGGAILVAAAYGATRECKPPLYENCIVGRRRFAFIDHVPLKLEIALEVSCVNVPCEAFSSCRSARCASSEATCDDDGTCTTPEREVPSDGGVVDGAVPGDGGDATIGPALDGGGPDASDGGSGEGGTGNPGPVSNVCPQNVGPTDCTLGQVTDACCVSLTGFYCTGPVNCVANGGQSLGCTGRKYCQQGLYCCYNGTTASCATGCGGSELLCSYDDDCPMGQTCRSVAFSRDMGQLIQKKCAP